MTEASTIPLADTSDMIQFHKIFREALGAAAPLIGSVAPDDTARVELVHAYYFNVLALLHGHHEGEDELVWPKLLERSPQDAEMVARIAAQHDDVLGALTRADELLAQWRAEPTVARGAELAAGLALLGAELTRHLDEEEQLILPLAARHITAPEWGQLPEHGFRTFTGDKVWLILGLVQEQMRPDQIEVMEAHMPPPVVAFWRGEGRAEFEAFITELRR